MDENLTHGESENSGNEPEESVSVFSGFIDMFSSPWEVGKRNVRSILGVLSFAIVIELFAIVGISYFYSASPGIHQELYQMGTEYIPKLANNPNFKNENIAEHYEKVEKSLQFDLTSSLWIGILKTAAYLLIFGVLFWITHRLFTSEPNGFVQVIGLISYGSAISATGDLLTGLVQFFTNSIVYAPNLGFLVGTSDAAMYGILARVDVFKLWYYFAIGIAIASSVGLSRKLGLIIGGIVYGFVFITVWSFFKILSVIFG